MAVKIQAPKDSSYKSAKVPCNFIQCPFENKSLGLKFKQRIKAVTFCLRSTEHETHSSLILRYLYFSLDWFYFTSFQRYCSFSSVMFTSQLKSLCRFSFYKKKLVISLLNMNSTQEQLTVDKVVASIVWWGLLILLWTFYWSWN